MSELLAVLVDCSPPAWAAIEAEPPRAPFPDFCAALLQLLSTFAAMGRRNRLMVLGYNGQEGGYLLLPAPDDATGAVTEHMRPGAFRGALEAALWRLRYGCAPPPQRAGGAGAPAPAPLPPPPPLSPLPPPLSPQLSSLTSCLALALCGLSARAGAPSAPSGTRVLCLHGSADLLGQYIAFNNAARCAHHAGILIDSVVLGATPSVFLQQAAHQTGGMYLQPPLDMHKGLLQYLHHLVLPPGAHRSQVLLPPRTSVNLRAHCLCHRRFCDTALMCTTCLSLWCDQPASGQCPACSASAAKAASSGGSSSGGGSSGGSSSSEVVAASSSSSSSSSSSAASTLAFQHSTAQG
jgi:hypothetical protein